MLYDDLTCEKGCLVMLALFRRLPAVGVVYTRTPLLMEEAGQAYPQYAEDLAFLERVLLPVYWRLDEQAARGQNTYRIMSLALLCGTSLLIMAGTIQLALGAVTASTVLRAVVTLLAILAGTLTQLARTNSSRSSYLTARRDAERLRTLYFAYLGRRDLFIGDERTRQQALLVRVLGIEQGGRDA